MYGEREQQYNDVLEKRFAVSLGLEMFREWSGEELIDRTVERYEQDSEVMQHYSGDTDQLREDLEYLANDIREDIHEMHEMSDSWNF